MTEKDERYSNYHQLVEQLTAENPDNLHIVLLDTDHTSVGLSYFLGSEDVIRTYRDSGIGLMSYEGPRESSRIESIATQLSQAVADRPEDISERGAAYNFIFQSTIRNVNRIPYHQHSLQDRIGISAGHTQKYVWPLHYGLELIQHDRGMSNDHIALEDALILQDYLGAIPEAKCAHLSNDAWIEYQDMNNERESASAALSRISASRDNSDIEQDNTAYIAAHAAGRSSVSVIGLRHATLHQDFDEYLAEATGGHVVTIALFADQQSRLISNQTERFQQLPDYMYIVDTDEMIRLEPGTPEADRFWARLPNPVMNTVPVLTEAEHHECIARLPESIQAYAPAFTSVETFELGGLPVQSVPQQSETVGLDGR